jgi:hypothetical protein
LIPSHSYPSSRPQTFFNINPPAPQADDPTSIRQRLT